MPVETFITDTGVPSVHYRQSIQPVYLRGNFVFDDTSFHDFQIDARGKGRMTIFVDIGDNTVDKTLRLYGMHDSTNTVGDDGVSQIGSDVTITSTNLGYGYETNNDPFPFFLVRVVSDTASPTSSGQVYVNLSAF